jgi:hypothetical protein
MRTRQTAMIHTELENTDYGLTLPVTLFVDFTYHSAERARYSGPLAGPGAPEEVEIDEVRLLHAGIQSRILQPHEYDEKAISQACLEAATQ